MKEDTWIAYWDDMKTEFISHDILHALSKKVGILGPTAAIFGREFEHFLTTEQKIVTFPEERLERSIQNTTGTLRRDQVTPSGTLNWKQWWSYSGENPSGQSSTEWKKVSADASKKE